jgi:hypothetical protein
VFPPDPGAGIQRVERRGWGLLDLPLFVDGQPQHRCVEWLRKALAHQSILAEWIEAGALHRAIDEYDPQNVRLARRVFGSSPTTT